MINKFSFEVLVNNKPIRQYAHDGRIFVEARAGVEYTLKVRNNTPSRILCVSAIDSLNVLDGKRDSDGGYVVNGYGSLDIKGWRIDNDTCNTFKFSHKKESYAAKSEETNGDTQNCGVIGFKIFGEKEKKYPIVTIRCQYPNTTPFWDDKIYDHPPYFTPWSQSTDSSASATSYNVESSSLHSPLRSMGLAVDNSLNKSSDPFNMGTAFSANKVESPIELVDFEVGHLISEYSIYYTNKDGLIKLGVPIDKKNESVCFPKAFTKFCKPPK